MQDTRIKHRVPQHTLYVGTNSLFDHSIVVFAEFVSGFLCILPDLGIIGIKRSAIDQTMSLLISDARRLVFLESDSDSLSPNWNIPVSMPPNSPPNPFPDHHWS